MVGELLYAVRAGYPIIGRDSSVADIDAARKTFEKFDRDGDGFVTAVEFQQAMVELGDRHYTVGLAEAILKTRDANADGVLSFDEFFQRAKEV